MANTFLLIGSLAGFLGVRGRRIWGAGLRGRLSPDMLGVFETAVRYQMYRVFALLVTAVIIGRTGDARLLRLRAGPLLPAWCSFREASMRWRYRGCRSRRDHADWWPCLSRRMGLPGHLRRRAVTFLDKWSQGLKLPFIQFRQVGGIHMKSTMTARAFVVASLTIFGPIAMSVPMFAHHGTGTSYDQRPDGAGQRQGDGIFVEESALRAVHERYRWTLQGQELCGGAEQPGRHDSAGLDQEADSRLATKS